MEQQVITHYKVIFKADGTAALVYENEEMSRVKTFDTVSGLLSFCAQNGLNPAV